MKKLSVYIALGICLCLGLGSCEYKEEIVKVDNTTQLKTLFLHVNQAEWNRSDDGTYFYCLFDVPELTGSIYDKGVVTCYREYYINTKNAYQIALPQTIHMVDDTDYYTQTIDYSFLPGLVEIVLTNSDFKYSSSNPDAMDFRLSMIWKN